MKIYTENLSVQYLKTQMKTGKLSSKQLVTQLINKIQNDQKHTKPLNAITKLMKTLAVKQAENADNEIKKGNDKILLGIPIIIKDNINIKGFETSCGSNILQGYKASFNATVINKLQNEGAITIAKSNMDEFAMGSSSEQSAKGLVRNFQNRNKIPGGSSGGSASAIAAKWAPLALGSDTGGSIRQPAALCGIVGMKPTYGRISRYGLVAYSSSFDQIGPLANSVQDTAILLKVISGHDYKDSTSSTQTVPNYPKLIQNNIKGKIIGIPKEYLPNTLPQYITKNINRAIEKLKSLGCIIKNINLPHTQYGIPVYYIIACAEASSNLSRFDGIRYGYRANENNLEKVFLNSRSQGFGTEVKRRIMLGTYVLSSGYYDAYYLKAQKVRTFITEDFKQAFKTVDAILTPSSPTTAFNIGEKINDPINMYLSDIFTVNLNLAGLPGISIPFGKDENSLPVGLQLIGNYFQEDKLLNIAYQLEEK